MSAWRTVNREGKSYLFSGKLSLIDYSLEELQNDPEVVWWRDEPAPAVILYPMSDGRKQDLLGNLYDSGRRQHGLFKIVTNPLPATLLGTPLLCDQVRKFIQGEKNCLGPSTFEIYWDDTYFSFPDARVDNLFDKRFDRRSPKEETSRMEH